MPPVRAFHLPGTEDDRPDAGADREHGELQAEEPLAPAAFIVAVMDTSNAVKLMLNTTNTTSSGRMPRYVSTLRGLAE